MAYTTIDKPSSYFNTKLYTGNSSTQSITGIGFKPDLLWIKGRTIASSNQINDVVRGDGVMIAPDNTDAQYSDTTRITSLDSDGFTLGSNSNTNGAYNYASFSWLAGGTGVSNTDGTITSTVSANTTSGLSIISYTGNSTAGATIGHGLGVAPKVVIVKVVSGSTNQWCVYHGGLNVANPADYVTFFSTGASTNIYNIWNDTAPSSSVVTLGDNSACNTNNTYLAYCFAEVKGFSKFGTYTPSSSAGSIFVYTGFKPSLIITKMVNGGATGHWWMHNWKSQTYNENGKHTKINVPDAEGDVVASVGIHSLSNGFYINAPAGSNYLHSGGEPYIYMAFAENPLVSSSGTPCTAR